MRYRLTVRHELVDMIEASCDYDALVQAMLRINKAVWWDSLITVEREQGPTILYLLPSLFRFDYVLRAEGRQKSRVLANTREWNALLWFMARQADHRDPTWDNERLDSGGGLVVQITDNR